MKKTTSSKAKTSGKSASKAKSSAVKKPIAVKAKTSAKGKVTRAKAGNSKTIKSAGRSSKKISVKGAQAKTDSPSTSSSLTALVGSGLSKVAERIENLFSSKPADIVAAIKDDHDSLREFLKVLKDTEKPMDERRRAYAQFSDLLKSHTTSEEQAVYSSADQLPGHEMHIKVAEGYVEHKLAEDLMKRIEKAQQPVEWSAHANVLAEIVEHHLDEEERDLLPLIRKEASAKLDDGMLGKYIDLREKTQKHVTKKSAGVLAAAPAVS